MGNTAHKQEAPAWTKLQSKQHELRAGEHQNGPRYSPVGTSFKVFMHK